MNLRRWNAFDEDLVQFPLWKIEREVKDSTDEGCACNPGAREDRLRG
jgi:hypothetical protein